MKISSHQVRAALAAYASGKLHRGAVSTSVFSKNAPGLRVAGLEDHFKELPDERDTIVHDLRRKIRHGRYYVSSRDIVDALLGRLTADLLNQE
jgi:Anti-sigma-28 factor, FlgM